MARYLMIESRDAFEHNDVLYYWDLAHGLVREGHEVTLFLVQNGVLSARASAKGGRLGDIASTGVRVLADDFSLRERGIVAEKLSAGVQPGTIEMLVDLLADPNVCAMWH